MTTANCTEYQPGGGHRGCRKWPHRIVKERIADGQIWKDHKVDLADKLGLLYGIDGFMEIIECVEELEGYIAIVTFRRQLPAMACGRQSILVMHGGWFGDGVLFHGGMTAIRRIHTKGFASDQPKKNR